MVIWQQQQWGYIFSQIFINNGTKLGSEFRTSNGSNYREPSITSLKNNNFAATWDFYPIYVQIFTNNGNVLGPQYNVFSRNEMGPTISSLSNGNFVVSWHSQPNEYDVYTQICYSDGTNMGNTLLVNTYIAGIQNYPSISSVSTGSFIIVWQSQGQDIIGGSDYGIYTYIMNFFFIAYLLLVK